MSSPGNPARLASSIYAEFAKSLCGFIAVRQRWAGGAPFYVTPRAKSSRGLNLRVPHSSVSEGCGFWPDVDRHARLLLAMSHRKNGALHQKTLVPGEDAGLKPGATKGGNPNADGCESSAWPGSSSANAEKRQSFQAGCNKADRRAG